MYGWAITVATPTVIAVMHLVKTTMTFGTSPGMRWRAMISPHKLRFVVCPRSLDGPGTDSILL